MGKTVWIDIWKMRRNERIWVCGGSPVPHLKYVFEITKCKRGADQCLFPKLPKGMREELKIQGVR